MLGRRVGPIFVREDGYAGADLTGAGEQDCSTWTTALMRKVDVG